MFAFTNSRLGSQIWSQNWSRRLVVLPRYVCIETLSNLFRPAGSYTRIRIRATTGYGVLSCFGTVLELQRTIRKLFQNIHHDLDLLVTSYNMYANEQ